LEVYQETGADRASGDHSAMASHSSRARERGVAHLDPRFEMKYASGTYEFRVQRGLLSNLRPGLVFYDVGAHIGIVSMFAAQVVGAEGAVSAFEADTENARRIEDAYTPKQA